MPVPLIFPPIPQPDPLLTIADCCAELKMSRKVFRKERQSPDFPLPVNETGHPRWTRTAIERWKHRPRTHTYARLAAGGRR